MTQVAGGRAVVHGPTRLDVPIMRQGDNCGCGIAAIGMVMRFLGMPISIRDLETHPLVLPRMLHRDGIGPGRLGRIALSLGFPVTIVDPSARDVGRLFVRAGGQWVREPPTLRHILEWLDRGVPVVVCIPDRRRAFEGTTRAGSHWVTIHAADGPELLIHDPAPWRKATRCRPGYWETWSCSLIAVGPPGARRPQGPAGSNPASPS